VSDVELLAAVLGAPDPVATAGEVGDAVGISRQGADKRLTTTGSHTVGRQLVGVTDTTDRDALADALADLGHSRRRAYTPALDAEGER